MRGWRGDREDGGGKRTGRERENLAPHGHF